MTKPGIVERIPASPHAEERERLDPQTGKPLVMRVSKAGMRRFLAEMDEEQREAATAPSPREES